MAYRSRSSKGGHAFSGIPAVPAALRAWASKRLHYLGYNVGHPGALKKFQYHWNLWNLAKRTGASHLSVTGKETKPTSLAIAKVFDWHTSHPEAPSWLTLVKKANMILGNSPSPHAPNPHSPKPASPDTPRPGRLFGAPPPPPRSGPIQTPLKNPFPRR